jgi:hypothetical protein
MRPPSPPHRGPWLELAVALPVLVSALVSVLVGLPDTARAQSESPPKAPPGKPSLLVEYCSRLAAAPPRSAAAQVELAVWCSAQGLEAEARKAYEQAIAIDLDCEAARAALGYERWGTGWRKKGEKAPARAPELAVPRAEPPSPPPAPAPPGAPGATPSPAASTVAAGAPPRTESPAEPPSGVAEPTPSPAVEAADPPPLEAEPPETASAAASAAAAFVSALEEKKAWAQAAAVKVGATFSTHEDKDFLIHTTLSKSSPELRALRTQLQGLKKLLTGIIGARGNAGIWPTKLQFVLLRSEPEYERFGTIVDGQQSVKNPDGAYVIDGRVVLWRPDSELVVDAVGSTALDRLHGHNRWVGWWLKDGVAEILWTATPQGQGEEHYRKTYEFAADVLRAEGDSFKVFNLLETKDYKSRNEDRNRALAMTLTDYLFRRNRSGFHGLIKALTSDEAPPPARSDAEFDSFYLSYVAFQSQKIESLFRVKIGDLDARWKEHVLGLAEKLKAQAEKEKAAAEDGKRGQ